MSKVLCAWCGVLMKDGALPISHGCCKSCVATLLGEVSPPVSPVERAIEETQRSRRVA
jgi:hypothetical protein